MRAAALLLRYPVERRSAPYFTSVAQVDRRKFQGRNRD